MSTIPAGGIMLHGVDDAPEHASRVAIQLRLSHRTLKDMREAAKSKSGLQLVTGKQPKLRIGSRSIDVNIIPSAYRHELYTTVSTTDLNFEAAITHQAELNGDHARSAERAGADEALATLQNTIASYNQEKKAKSTTISDSVLPEFRNRFEAAKKQKRGGLLGSHSGASSPAFSGTGTPSLGPATTSASSAVNPRQQAMRTAVVHLLAMAPASSELITSKTHIPKSDLEPMLAKLGQQQEGKWKLSDRIYKELDVWKFGYAVQADRQRAIDNAVRAFDRLRVGKEEQLWQKLLPEEERGKGIVLSKLHLSTGAQNKGLTPNWAPSPRAAAVLTDDEDGDDTPRPGPAHTPKVGATKTANGEMKKRLLSKDPKKARAAEDAKDKKRKERETVAAATVGREPGSKKSSTPLHRAASFKPAPAKVKSAELVFSSGSDDEADAEEGEVKAAISGPKSRPTHGSSPESSDERMKADISRSTPNTLMTGNKPTRPTAAPSSASSTIRAVRPSAAGRNTPNIKKAGTPSSQHKSQTSPDKIPRKPDVPSPLGANRPRVTSNVSDRSAVGVQRAKQGADTPKGLGITSNAESSRKRQDTVVGHSSSTIARNTEKPKYTIAPDHPPRYTLTNSTNPQKPKTTKEASHRPETGSKRKADIELNSSATAKHQKVNSYSPASQRSHSSSTATVNSMATSAPSTSPGQETSTSNDSSSDIINNITFSQGVRLAQDFRDKLYPAYAKSYDDIMRRRNEGEHVPEEETAKLLDMHRKLEVRKREIVAASQRENDG